MYHTLTTNFYIRASAVSLILSGICIASFWLLTTPFDSFATAAVSLHPFFDPGQALHAAGAAASVIGYIGLFLTIRAKSHAFLGLGFFIATLGALLFFADAMIALVSFPTIAANAPLLLENDGAMFSGRVMGFFVAFSAIQMVGTVSLAFLIRLYGDYPLTPCLLLGLGGILYNLPPFPGAHAVLIAGGVLWSIAVTWMGFVMLSRNPNQSS